MYQIKYLLFNLNNTESFNAISNIVEKANFLKWTGLRQAPTSILKTIEYSTFTANTYFKKGDEIFDKAEKKTNDCQALIISEKALLSSNVKKLKHDYSLSDKDLKIAFNLSHFTAQVPYNIIMPIVQLSDINPFIGTDKFPLSVGGKV